MADADSQGSAAAKRKKTKTRRRKRVPRTLVWLRSVSAASILLGGVGLTTQPAFFRWGVGFVYFGFLLLGADWYFETRSWERCKIARLVGFIVLAALVAVFSRALVFVKAPLEVKAIATPAEYPAGTVISGITWKPEFEELQIIIANPSEIDYEDLNIALRVDYPIAAIQQENHICQASFEDVHQLEIRMMYKEAMESLKANPMSLLATDAGYRVRCAKLPAKETLRLVLAVTDIKWTSKPRTDDPLKYIHEKDYMMRFRVLDDYSTYWYGQSDGDVYVAPGPLGHVKVEGEYTARLQRRLISQDLTIAVPRIK